MRKNLKRIVYIVPYFGKLPNEFPVWLHSCRYNETIDWFIFTDDKTEYNYPSNVHVFYMEFSEVKNLIQERFEFNICLQSPYKLCDYKVAYGEIFQEYIKEYDFWGYCDIDLIWGDIRKFLTNEILDKYDKIGSLGHSTLYRNVEEVNLRYRLPLDGVEVYRDIFTKSENYLFDEIALTRIYINYGFDYYDETIMADINCMNYNFFINHLPKNHNFKNKYQIFCWDKGTLNRIYYTDKIYFEEYMYIHFLRRPMKNRIKKINEIDKFLIVPNYFCEYKEDISVSDIKKYSKNRMIKYYFNKYKLVKHKITIKYLFNLFKRRLKSRINMIFSNNSKIHEKNIVFTKDGGPKEYGKFK